KVLAPVRPGGKQLRHTLRQELGQAEEVVVGPSVGEEAKRVIRLGDRLILPCARFAGLRARVAGSRTGHGDQGVVRKHATEEERIVKSERAAAGQQLL